MSDEQNSVRDAAIVEAFKTLGWSSGDEHPNLRADNPYWKLCRAVWSACEQAKGGVDVEAVRKLLSAIDSPHGPPEGFPSWRDRVRSAATTVRASLSTPAKAEAAGGNSPRDEQLREALKAIARLTTELATATKLTAGHESELRTRDRKIEQLQADNARLMESWRQAVDDLKADNAGKVVLTREHADALVTSTCGDTTDAQECAVLQELYDSVRRQLSRPAETPASEPDPTKAAAPSHSTLVDQASSYRTCMRIAQSLGATAGDLSGWIHKQASEIVKLTAQVESEADRGSQDAWMEVESVCQNAWPSLKGYAESPAELIIKIIDERDEAKAELSAIRTAAEGLLQVLGDDDAGKHCTGSIAESRTLCRTCMSADALKAAMEKGKVTP